MPTFRFHALTIAIAATTLSAAPLAQAGEADGTAVETDTSIRALDAVQVQGSLLGRSSPRTCSAMPAAAR